MNKLKEFIEKYKGESWFRPVIVLIISLVIAVGIGIYDDITNPKPKEPPISTNMVINLFYENRVHILLFGVTFFSLAYISHSNDLNRKD